jgi:hypothetical protein
MACSDAHVRRLNFSSSNFSRAISPLKAAAAMGFLRKHSQFFLQCPKPPHPEHLLSAEPQYSDLIHVPSVWRTVVHFWKLANTCS